MVDFRRKKNRLPAVAYRGRGAYFLTICVQRRRTVFTDSQLVEALLEILRETCRNHAFAVYAYCFMPDHVHLILVAEKGSPELAGMVRTFKGIAARAARRRGIVNLWQKGFYDHVIRSGNSLDEAAWYVLMNPVRARFVKNAEEWLFSGSFLLDWKKIAAPSTPYVRRGRRKWRGKAGARRNKDGGINPPLQSRRWRHKVASTTRGGRRLLLRDGGRRGRGGQ